MFPHHRRFTVCLVWIGIVTGLVSCGQRLPADPIASGLSAIDSESLLDDVRWLASPQLDGRLPGSPGYEEALRGVVRRFERLGLVAGGDDGFCQQLSMEYNRITAEPRLSLIDAAGDGHDCRLGDDFVCRGFTGSGQVTAPVVFVGYGISRPESGYDDYEGVDVQGKIVLCLKPNPRWRLNDEAWGWRSRTWCGRRWSRKNLSCSMPTG